MEQKRDLIHLDWLVLICVLLYLVQKGFKATSTFGLTHSPHPHLKVILIPK